MSHNRICCFTIIVFDATSVIGVFLLSLFSGICFSWYLSPLLFYLHQSVVICLRTFLLTDSSFHFHLQLSSCGPPSTLSHPKTSLSLFYISKHDPVSIYPIAQCFSSLSFLFSSFPLFTIIIPLLDPVILFCPSFLYPPHSFISGLLALMSIAMARSIQDGVFVLSTGSKMNVPAMHHSHLTL